MGPGLENMVDEARELLFHLQKNHHNGGLVQRSIIMKKFDIISTLYPRCSKHLHLNPFALQPGLQAHKW